jgi:hypothetical protein
MIKSTTPEFAIEYFGTPDELRTQINFILDDWQKCFRGQIKAELDNLEEIDDPSNHFGDMNQRIYFNNQRILYSVNSSYPEEIKFHFGLIKKICSNADCKFLGNPDLLEE